MLTLFLNITISLIFYEKTIDAASKLTLNIIELDVCVIKEIKTVYLLLLTT